MSPDQGREIKKHLTEHVSYPASREDIVQSCNRMEHASDDEKKYVSENLPDGTYESAEDALDVLGMEM